MSQVDPIGGVIQKKNGSKSWKKSRRGSHLPCFCKVYAPKRIDEKQIHQHNIPIENKWFDCHQAGSEENSKEGTDVYYLSTRVLGESGGVLLQKMGTCTSGR